MRATDIQYERVSSSSSPNWLITIAETGQKSSLLLDSFLPSLGTQCRRRQAMGTGYWQNTEQFRQHDKSRQIKKCTKFNVKEWQLIKLIIWFCFQVWWFVLSGRVQCQDGGSGDSHTGGGGQTQSDQVRRNEECDDMITRDISFKHNANTRLSTLAPCTQPFQQKVWPRC